MNKINIANYADNNTPYTRSKDVNGLTESLEEASKELFKWFDDNLMKSNTDKCHLLDSTNDNVATSCLSIIIYQKYAKKLVENFML